MRSRALFPWVRSTRITRSVMGAPTVRPVTSPTMYTSQRSRSLRSCSTPSKQDPSVLRSASTTGTSGERSDRADAPCHSSLTGPPVLPRSNYSIYSVPWQKIVPSAQFSWANVATRVVGQGTPLVPKLASLGGGCTTRGTQKGQHIVGTPQTKRASRKIKRRELSRKSIWQIVGTAPTCVGSVI